MNSAIRFREKAANWGADISAIIGVRYWGFFVAALIIALGSAKRIYLRMDFPQIYSELIVGGIGWAYQNKFHDYALLYGLVFFFLIAIAAIGALAVSFSRVAGPKAVERFHDLLLILCFPAVLWFASLWTSKNISFDLLSVSVVLIVFSLVLSALMVFRGKAYWADQPDLLIESVRHGVAILVFSALAVVAIGVAVNRISGILESAIWMSSNTVLRWLNMVGVCVAVACFGWIIHAQDSAKLLRGMRSLSRAAQLFLPLFFFCMLPPAWKSASGDLLASGYEVTTFGKLFVAICILLAYVEHFLSVRLMPACDPGRVYFPSVGFSIAVLLFLKTAPFSLPTRMWDDYHFGEMLVPWWSWWQMGLVPFWDYAPARGLMNYFPGFFASAIFGGNPAATEATYPFIYAMLAVVALPVLRRSLGTGGALAALLLGPFANAIGEIDLAVSIFLFASCWGWLNWSKDRWLTFMAAAGVALLLYAPGQAALTLLACAPLAIVAMYRLYNTERRKLIVVLVAVAAVSAILFSLTPLGKMFYGALRYGFEQSKINSIAHGVDWGSTFGLTELNPWLFEIMRTSFIIIVLWAGTLVLKALFMRAEDPIKIRLLTYALPVFIIGLLFVIRAAGRVDPGMSRLGVASVWALSLLLPMLLFVSVERVRATHLFFWFLGAGFLVPYAGSLPVAAYRWNFDIANAVSATETSFSRSLAGSRLAAGSEGPEHPARVAAVKDVLDKLLGPDETYLDLSGRHAMYYYVNRKPALESASMYNLVGEKQQLRAIASIRKGNFPAILLSADNIIHDGGPSSLRSNLVYREVLLSKGYKLATVGKQVWMVRDDRIARLATGQASSLVDLSSVEALSVLEPVYHQKDLRGVPASWGRSVASLEKELSVPVLKVDSAAPSGFSGVRVLGNGSYAIEGSDPHVRFDISGSALSGRQAGVLSFDFSCEQLSAAPMVGVYWSAPGVPESEVTFLTFRGHQGRLLVPIDSAPSWLLAGKLNTLRFDIDGDSTGCQKFTLRNVELLARNATLEN